jgi:hypothetical protein
VTGLEESVTATVNVEEPAVVGVPEITPAPDNVRPAGSEPELTRQRSAPVPPVASSVWEYATPVAAAAGASARAPRGARTCRERSEPDCHLRSLS